MSSGTTLAFALAMALAITACGTADNDTSIPMESSEHGSLGVGERVYLSKAEASAIAENVIECSIDRKADGRNDKGCVVICHVPTGNPAAQHTLMVGYPTLAAHSTHGPHSEDETLGDYLGECDEGGSTPAKVSKTKTTNRGTNKG